MIMEHTVFNEAQLDILNMMQWVKSPEALSDLKQAISDFFAKKAKLLFQTTFHGIDVEINYLPAVLTCHGGLACCAIHATYKI